MMKRNKMHISVLAMSLLSFGILSIGSMTTANASHIHQNQQPQIVKINHIKHLYNNQATHKYNQMNSIKKYNINQNYKVNNSRIIRHNHKHVSVNAMNYIKINHHFHNHKIHSHKRMTRTNYNANAPINPADEEQGVKVNFKATPVNYKKIDQQNNNDWFRAGLNNSNFNARQTIVSRESGGHWNILSYGHRCIGYFQLDPAYLGYKNGHVNLNHKHQVKVANRYVKNRYGSWVNALRFWNSNQWY